MPYADPAKRSQASRESHARNPHIKRGWVERNPQKRAAQVTVGNAVRDGRLFKRSCEICGSNRVHAHHDDYSKPLEVRWLCPQHHADEHAEVA